MKPFARISLAWLVVGMTLVGCGRLVRSDADRAEQPRADAPSERSKEVIDWPEGVASANLPTFGVLPESTDRVEFEKVDPAKGDMEALAVTAPHFDLPPPKLVGARELTENYADGTPRVVRGIKEYDDGTSANHGLYTEWYPNGKKFCSGRYVDGLRSGTWTFWHENGAQAKSGSYQDGKPEGPWTYWRAGGTKEREENYLDGKRHGAWMYYSEQGQPTHQEEYRNGKRHGTWIDWYPDGKKSSEAHLVDNELDGVQTIWYRNGQRAREAEFKNGRRNGRFAAWNERGEPISEVIYRNDVVVKTIE